MRRIQLATLATVALAGCGGGEGGSVACGLAAMSGPLIALEGFARGDGLALAPDNLPPSLPARYVAGPVTTALVSRGDSLRLLAAIEAAPPEGARPGYGVLLLDRSRDPLGILVYDGVPVRGAVTLGDLSVADTTLPLLGVMVTPDAIQDDRCPVFPAE